MLTSNQIQALALSHGFYPDVEFTKLVRAIEQAARREALENACDAIRAEDDRASAEDYMLDSDDCIAVIRALMGEEG